MQQHDTERRFQPVDDLGARAMADRLGQLPAPSGVAGEAIPQDRVSRWSERRRAVDRSAFIPVLAFGIAVLTAPVRRRSWLAALPLALVIFLAWSVSFGPAFSTVAAAEARPHDRSRPAVDVRDADRWRATAPDAGRIVLDGRPPAAPIAIAAPNPWVAWLAASWRSVGLILTVAVLALLLLREALPSGRAERRLTGRRAITVLTVPLTFIVSVALLGQLVTVAVPVFAAEFALTAATPGVAQAESAIPAATAAAPAPTGTAAVAVEAATASPAAATDVPPTATPVVPTPTTLASARTPAQVAATVAALRSGEIDVTIIYTNGFSSNANVRFDLGTGQQPARLASVTTFQGATGMRTTERVVIGTQAWTRETGGAWVATAAPGAVREEILALLPDGTAVQTATGADAGALRWVDQQRNADARLELAPITGVPHRMVQTSRGTGTVLTARYQGWNTAVTIDAPVTR